MTLEQLSRSLYNVARQHCLSSGDRIMDVIRDEIAHVCYQEEGSSKRAAELLGIGNQTILQGERRRKREREIRDDRLLGP
jgi:hypothetical protein